VESSPSAPKSKESAVPDEIDLALLRVLQRAGRIPLSELATRVGIAESTCHKRVRALVASGAISGFHAAVDAAVLGLGLEALISIRLHSHARSGLKRFQDYLERLPATQRVYFVSGDRDFLLHVAVRDAAELRTLVSETLSVREEVAATNTSVIFEHAPGRLAD
jgi:DNA-binding Lrp family transcriptional regulator